MGQDRVGVAARRLGDARKDLEQRRFPRAVAADASVLSRWSSNADDLALLHLKETSLSAQRREVSVVSSRVISFQFRVVCGQTWSDHLQLTMDD